MYKKKLGYLVILLAGCANAPRTPRTALTLEQMAGKWQVVSLEGGDPPDEGRDVFEIRRDGDKWQATTTRDGLTYSVPVTLDNNLDPPVLNCVHEGKTVCAFEVALEGNRMTWTATDGSYKGVMNRLE